MSSQLPDTGTIVTARSRHLEIPGARSERGNLIRILVRTRAGILPVDVSRIDRFEARGDYVACHLEGGTHLIRLTLKELEQQLDSRVFLRVHRSHIVNLESVRIMQPRPDTRLDVFMKDNSRITASRTYSRLIRKLAS